MLEWWKDATANKDDKTNFIEDETEKTKMAKTSGDSIQMLGDMKVNELKDELKARKLQIGGNKEELMERLKKALKLEDERSYGLREITGSKKTVDEQDEEEASDDEDSGESEDNVGADEMARNAPNRRKGNQPYLTFRDVEESMCTFSGDDKKSIGKWIDDFEEMSELCKWSDIQNVIYSKRLLRGSARLFVDFERCNKSWRKLRDALLGEFTQKINSRTVHKELSRRKKLNNESYQEYVYKMMEIASQTEIEKEAVIQYIIDGILDDDVNKTILYGARNIKELRSKLTIYENMRMSSKLKSKSFPEKTKEKSEAKSSGTGARQRNCFNCGAKDHISTNCPSKEKGTKCFQCGEFGHIASKCTNKTKKADAAGIRA